MAEPDSNLGAPRFKIGRKKTHSCLAPAGPPAISHIFVSPRTYLTPSTVLHESVSGELGQKTEFLILRMTLRSFCSIYDPLVFSIFKMDIVGAGSDLNTKFSGNIRISIEEALEAIWLEGRWEGLRDFF